MSASRPLSLMIAPKEARWVSARLMLSKLISLILHCPFVRNRAYRTSIVSPLSRVIFDRTVVSFVTVLVAGGQVDDLVVGQSIIRVGTHCRDIGADEQGTDFIDQALKLFTVCIAPVVTDDNACDTWKVQIRNDQLVTKLVGN